MPLNSDDKQRNLDREVIRKNTEELRASGIDLTSGSPLDVLAEQHRLTELRALNERKIGQIEAERILRFGI